MADIVTLVPYAQALNADDIYPVRDNIQRDTPVAIGSGSLSDDSDSTGLQIGAWSDTTTTGTPFHAELTSVDFKLPNPTLTPTALCFQMRAMTDPTTAANPPGHPLDLFEWVMRPAGYADHRDYIDRASRTEFDVPVLAPLYHRNTPVNAPTWFTFYSADGTANPTDPTSAGWLQVGPASNENYYGLTQALTTDGLRVTFSLFWNGEDPFLDRRAWWDIFEFRLLVAVTGAAPPPYIPPVRVTPSLRMLQRGGSGGMSGIPRMVGDPTRRGIRQGPGSIY